MVKALQRHGTLLGGIGLCGAICIAARPFLISARGSAGPTILHAESWVVAAIAIIVCMTVATIIAIAVGRVINSAVGLFVLGAGLFVLARRLASVKELVYSGSTLGPMAAETFLWALLVLAATLAVFLGAGPLRDVHPKDDRDASEPLFGPDALIAASAGVIMLPVVWILARSPMPGQVLGAAFVGAALAGLIGRLLRPNVQPVLLFASPVIFGAIGHLVAAMWTDEPLDMAYVSGTLSTFALPRPIDYAAGSLMGVAFGLGWAKSFLTHHEHDEAH